MFKRIFIAVFCIVALAITPSVKADDVLDARFAHAVEVVNNLPDNPPRSMTERLEFYGFYKVATMGPCHAGHRAGPGFEGQMKFAAWKSKSENSRDDAKQGYINMLASLLPEWEDM